MSEKETDIEKRVEGEEKHEIEEKEESKIKAECDGLNLPELEKATSTRTTGVHPPYSIYTKRQKWALVALVSAAGIFSPMSANIFFPSIPNVANDLHTTIEKINVSVTIYMISQGISPSVWGSICDVNGRRPVFIMTFLVYIGACAGLAKTHAYWLLVVLRFIQAAGSSSVNSIGGGVIGDVAPPHERGGFMGIYSLGPMLGPCIGPVIGGLFSETQSWQSMFIFLACFAGAVTLCIIMFLPETLRSLVGNGSIPPKGLNKSPLYSYIEYKNRKRGVEEVYIDPSLIPPRKTWKDINWLAPLLILKEKDAFMILAFNALCYTLFYSVITSTSNLFKENYGLTEIKIGLCYLGFGGGCILSAIINTRRLDYDFKTVAKRHGKGNVRSKKDLNDLRDFPIEEARLRSLPYTFGVMAAVIIIYGWCVDKRVHLAVPIICQFFVGLCSTMQTNSFSTLLIDNFPTRSASAIAANNLTRCLLGAAGVAVFDPLLRAIGPGWTYTLLPLIVLLFFPFWFLLIKYGKGIRNERYEREHKDK